MGFRVRHLLWLGLVLGHVNPARADPQADYANAIKADLAGDQAKAFGLYLKAAKAGLPDAELNVAVMYDSGRGTRADPVAAALFYAFAAVNGRARAAYNLALLYQSGDGVPHNRQQAEAWFRAAGRLGLAAHDDQPEPAGRHAPQPFGEGSAAPLAATLAYPLPGAAIEAGQDTVPLVWTAPAEPRQYLYYVELLSLNGPAPVPVLTQTLDLSALRAPIGQKPGQYAWRVFTFCQSAGTYSASAWARFSVA